MRYGIHSGTLGNGNGLQSRATGKQEHTQRINRGWQRSPLETGTTTECALVDDRCSLTYCDRIDSRGLESIGWYMGYTPCDDNVANKGPTSLKGSLTDISKTFWQRGVLKNLTWIKSSFSYGIHSGRYRAWDKFFAKGKGIFVNERETLGQHYSL